MNSPPVIQLFAAQGNPLLMVAAVILTALAFLGLAVFALCLFRGFEALARRSLTRCYADLTIHYPSVPGDGQITYHTYHGLIAWFTETPHQVSLPPDQARQLLRRLLWFNLTWGLTSYGALFIPLLAIGNYFAQLRAIAKQETAIALAPLTLVAANEEGSQNPYASPLVYEQTPTSQPRLPVFYLVTGILCGLLALLFAISTIVGLARLDFKQALGGALMAALIGWTAWSFLQKRA